MTEIKIGVKRTGFPVKIGEIELWFDSSIENLTTFFNIEELARERLKIMEEKATHIHFPDEINPETVQKMDGKTIDDALSLKKEYIAIQYDLMFGDDTFKKIYAQYPDIFALEEILDEVGVAVAESIEQQDAKRREKSVLKMSDHLSKKANKK